MDFGLSEETRLLIKTVREFVRNELYPLEQEVEEKDLLEPEKAREIFEKSRALGFYAMNIPEKFGGGGLSAVDNCLVEEQFGHTSDVLIRRAFGNVYESLLLCDSRQRERWLLPCVRGERTASIAITEPEAGSDAAKISTRAVRDGEGWRLSGRKLFISDAAFSDFFIASAVTDPDAGPRGISLFLVDKSLPGFSLGRMQTMMGHRGTSVMELFFDDVPLERMALLGEEGRGLKIILETLGRVRLVQIGARAIGKASRITQLMTDYANERRQFGKPIGDFQMIQTMLADSAIEINAARWLMLRAAWELDQGLDAREKISMVKVFAAEMLGKIADRAVQVFGGMGYCTDLPIERYYRDSRIFRIYDGTSEIHRTVVAKALLRDCARIIDDPL